MSRFDKYDADIRNCWCPLCLALAKAANRPHSTDWRPYSDALFAALEAGTHAHEGPHESPEDTNRRLPSEDVRHFLRYGTGIGVTQRPEHRAERGFGELNA